MHPDDKIANSQEGEISEQDGITNSEEDEIANSGEDDWDDDDDFRAPTCCNPLCSGSNLYSSGRSLSICPNCRSVRSNGAAISVRDAFPYRPIVEDSELRLLLVWPPRDKEDSIHCSLVHVRLNTDIEYDAVSYTWADETGDDARNKTVFIDNRPLPVTSTCEAVLRRTRLLSTAKVLWIDAVCINQSDKDERGHQVRLMPKIYSHARKVLIFPGDATDKDSKGFYYLPKLEKFLSKASEDRGLDIWKSVQHTVRHLFSRRYFTRVWIVQEIALAKDPIVMYGVYEVSWNTIRTAISHPLERYTESSNWSYHTPPRSLLHPSEPLPKVLSLDSATVRGPADLLHLLDMASNSQAHDPRDKVFALFGMIHFASRFGLVADYNESVEEAFARVAVLLAAEHGLLPILGRTIGAPARRALASWVPDWSNLADENPYTVPMFVEEIQPARDKNRRLLSSLAHIPILARPHDYEMDFIGAWVCDLGTLFYAGLDVQVFTTTGGHPSPKSMSDLEVLYRALNLPEGGSLCCYLPMPPTDAPTRYLDEQHLERELRRLRAVNVESGVADLFRQRGSEPRCELILSSGSDGFCFAGLCVLSTSSLTRFLSGASSRHHVSPFVPDAYKTSNDMRAFLKTELVSLVSRHRLQVKVKQAPPTSEHPTNSINLEGFLAMTRARKLQRPIRSSPPGMLGGEDGWLKGWADRELHFLDGLLQTPEGKAMLRNLDTWSDDTGIIWPDAVSIVWLDDMSIIGPNYIGIIVPDATPRLPLELLVDSSLTNLLGHGPVEFQRLTLKLGD